MSKQTGRAFVFGDDVDTDLIYHNKYLAETDPAQMPQYSFEYYPGHENFAKEVKPGDFVVAGKNFGCGSSREHAVYCLQYAGVPCVLAETCSRIYYRNAINNGYPVLF
ncbi:MAG: 3-isopropylmalate dehydratase small subunit, partial [Pyramidobacter sp.]|nr:3-isopropylmalate dehydratase small subunit [Pyramidobacter sp.]